MSASVARIAKLLLVGLSLGLATGGAAAQTPGVTTFWRCWYNGDLRVACMLREAGNVEADATLVDRYRNANLPGIVKASWTEPSQLDGLIVMIPLFTDPEDWVRVELLSQSVTCGAKGNCMVAFHRSFAEAVALDPLVAP